jgi:hypothetical protein
MTSFSRIAVAGIVAAGLAAPAAAVDMVSFTATGAFDASWMLPKSPVPDFVFGNAFRVQNVDITFNGNPVTAFVEFYTLGGGGGACAGSFCSLFDLYGPTLFSGTTAAPTFLTGVFDMNQGFPFGPDVRLVIADPGNGAGVIPEPATWAMLIAGFGLVGSALRRRREAANTTA